MMVFKKGAEGFSWPISRYFPPVFAWKYTEEIDKNKNKSRTGGSQPEVESVV
jgi:hypothetical protein